MKKLAKHVSRATHTVASTFVSASSPLVHAPKIPASLKKTK
ncbi:AgrD family cyclic lactone autoinducer peptide [Bacillus sp. SD088]|nr:cyclic lactone autoinducer peptide [Bacillus sp. SD088]MBO0996040.1 cyclic lactone autoinducer peptide [Bacillus sp. SD088]